MNLKEMGKPFGDFVENNTKGMIYNKYTDTWTWL